MRTSDTPSSNSAWDTLGAYSFRLDDSWNRDDLVTAHNERPRLACRTWDLRVDEHVLDLLRPSREPVAGAPGSYLKPWELRGDAPLAPGHFTLECDRALLDPDLAVLAHDRRAAAEI